MLRLVFNLWLIGSLYASTTPAKEATSSMNTEPKAVKQATATQETKIEPKVSAEHKAKKFDPLNESAEEEISVFLELAKRSQEISSREETLKQQALTLKAAEASLNEKLKHFDLLKQDLLKMLDRLKDKEEKQVEDLVKMYESMKPKQAANIFNQMDMIVLKEIIKRMGRKKAALVIAAMDVKKAKDLSQMLAKETQNIS